MDQGEFKEEDISFYLNCAEAWDAMYDACLAAEMSIEMEQYIFADDKIGQKFLRVFIAKLQQGLEVRLILDKFGSWGLVSSVLLKEFQEKGGQVYFYNPLKLWNIFTPSIWLPRDHTKTTIIDSKIAYTGSVCIAEYMSSWRDTQACIKGNLVLDIHNGFNCLWESLSKKLKYKRCIYPENFNVSYAVNAPQFPTNPIYKSLLLQIKNAEKSIFLVSPYFFPPIRLRKELKDAARRGVDIKVMISGNIDVPFSNHMSHSYFPPLITEGIEILIYSKTILHAKYAIIDDKWATMGSTNLDYLSLLSNREANLIIMSQSVIAKLRSHFMEDIKECITVGPEVWTQKPLFYKIMAYFGLFFKKVL
jgi:cardiolipin synthase